MNAIVLAETLAPATPAKAAELIARMMASMMAPKDGEFSDAVAADYVAAVTNCPEWAIRRVSEDYRFGRRGDGRFAPLPGEFGKAVNALADQERTRVVAQAAVDRQAAENRSRTQMLAERTPEQRERVRKAHEAWRRAYQRYESERNVSGKDREELRAEMARRTNERFDPYTLTGGRSWER